MDQEFLDASLKDRNSQASFATKLTKYSNELMINKERLIQIQKILYTDKRSDKRGRHKKDRDQDSDPLGRRDWKNKKESYSKSRSKERREARFGKKISTNHSSIHVTLP